MIPSASKSTLRDDFCAALDAQSLPSDADAIVVLRNWDRELTNARMNHAIDLLLKLHTPMLAMVYEASTKEEANRFNDLTFDAGWSSIILATHRAHHYRAYLTFKRVLMSSLHIYSSPVESAWDENEFKKIEEYQAQGDAASYEQGLLWLTQS